MTVYGYARVSTDGQTLASQDAQLHAAGCAKVYSEKVSGAKTDRAELATRRIDQHLVHLLVVRVAELLQRHRGLQRGRHRALAEQAAEEVRHAPRGDERVVDGGGVPEEEGGEPPK
jgi:hypothetical protein